MIPVQVAAIQAGKQCRDKGGWSNGCVAVCHALVHRGQEIRKIKGSAGVSPFKRLGHRLVEKVMVAEGLEWIQSD